MIELISRLENIEFHLKQLKGDNATLAIENEALKRQNAELKKAIIEKQEAIINLEEINKISILAQGVRSSSDNSMVKLEIDHLIKEIDECLALVKQ